AVGGAPRQVRPGARTTAEGACRPRQARRLVTTTRKTSQRRTITLERTFTAPVEDVWELWTTREGIESWWGPDGFTVKVRKLDLRVGGELLYDMIATAPEQIEFMKKAGMPTSHPA